MQIDESTGLPKLPEGLFWVVGRLGSAFWGDFLEVKICRRAQKWRWGRAIEVTKDFHVGDEQMVWYTDWYDFEMADQEDRVRMIRGLAERAYERFVKLTDPGVHDLLGEYPPKRLES